MVLEAVGAKTWQWNNDLKSLLFLLLYPIVITPVYAAVLAVLIFYFAFQQDDHRHGNQQPALIAEYTHLYHTLIVDYWYVPYVLLVLFLLVMYARQRRRLDILPGFTAVTRESRKDLYECLENLCISRGLAMPYFFIQEHVSCNAYTTGLTPETYCMVITSGLLAKLDRAEVEAVLAHELTHLLNGDTRLLFLTGAVSNMFRTLSGGIWSDDKEVSLADSLYREPQSGGHTNQLGMLLVVLMTIFKLGNIGTLFAQLFISRKREYIADAGAIELTKNPEALIAALQIVGENTYGFADQPALKPRLFNYRDPGQIIGSHPSIEDRIAAIRFYHRMPAENRPKVSNKIIRQAKAEKDIVW